MFKKKYLLLTLFLIIIFQILLYTNNNQKTSFRYFKWTLKEVSIGKLISISFFSGLFVSTLLNTTVTSNSFRKKTFENVEDDFVSENNEEDMESNIEMPPQRDIRETQPTISVNYRVVKNMDDNNFKKDRNYSNNPDTKDDWDNADNDWYEYRSRQNLLIGRKSKKSYKVGDPIEVKIIKVDILKYQIDLELT